MIPINSVWQQYFKNRHEGLGTTYERFILHHYFERIKNKYSIKSVLEVPSFGMTGISGINSIWWAYKGAHITITDNNKERINLIKKVWQELSLEANFVYYPNGSYLPLENHSFDMGWNFAALWFVPNLDTFLGELTRVTKKVIFICVPNRLNLFHLLRLAFQKNSEMQYLGNIKPVKIKEIMLTLKWHVEEEGYLDIPPWPDIAMNKEDLLQKIGLKWLANKLKSKEENYICILDFFSGKKKDMDKEILRYAFLEDSLSVFQKFWAHHHYFIFTPKQ
jgi:2-polyprenyl-3-methyl-5-hydroxy-6-metoxy-1,4-benzoquinol methylase